MRNAKDWVRGGRRSKEPEWEMWRTERTGRGGLDRVKNRSGKYEKPGEGVDGVKNWSGNCEGPGRWGDQRLFEKIKVFLKNQKHEPNIVEITHLCIMHGAHTSQSIKHYLDFSFVFSAPLPAWKNLFSAIGIFCGGRYQPGCTGIFWPAEGTSQPLTISKKWIKYQLVVNHDPTPNVGLWLFW